MKNLIEFTRVNNDSFGNPRYVVHFLNFINDNDEGSILEKKSLAVQRAKLINGKDYRGKDYGGGIVFTIYSPEDKENEIINLMKKY